MPVRIAVAGAGWALLAIASLSMIAPPRASAAETPIISRHIETSREEANKRPRSEGDQTVVAGWPLYRSARGQAAFNHTMATLAATDSAAPRATAFKGCQRLDCPVVLPRMSADGWLPAGRIWMSPDAYVLIAHSPRNASGKYRRHAYKRMKYFILHEFINSSRNVDPYDTISSHDDDVFVSFYMSKQRTDARGKRFVAVVQVAPYDVVSVHATNFDSLGPGIEVAKNAGEELEPLQAQAGILVAEFLKRAAPHLEVVHHRGEEGLPMLQAYQRRLRLIGERPAGAAVTLPYVPADAIRMALATQRLEHLVLRTGASPPIPVAQRAFAPVRAAATSAAPPVLVEPPRPALRPRIVDGRGT